MKWTKEKPNRHGWFLVRLAHYDSVGDKTYKSALAEIYPDEYYKPMVDCLLFNSQIYLEECMLEFSDMDIPEPEEE